MFLNLLNKIKVLPVTRRSWSPQCEFMVVALFLVNVAPVSAGWWRHCEAISKTGLFCHDVCSCPRSHIQPKYHLKSFVLLVIPKATWRLLSVSVFFFLSVIVTVLNTSLIKWSSVWRWCAHVYGHSVWSWCKNRIQLLSHVFTRVNSDAAPPCVLLYLLACILQEKKNWATKSGFLCFSFFFIPGKFCILVYFWNNFFPEP